MSLNDKDGGIRLQRREYESLTRVTRRLLTAGGTGIRAAVTSAATTLAVAFAREEPDTNYGVIVTPSWLTTFRVTAKTTKGCTVDFGTAAPAGATLDYVVVRS